MVSGSGRRTDKRGGESRIWSLRLEVDGMVCDHWYYSLTTRRAERFGYQAKLNGKTTLLYKRLATFNTLAVWLSDALASTVIKPTRV